MTVLIDLRKVVSETVSVDPLRFEVRVDGVETDLSKSLLVLLHTLMLHPHQVFTLEDLRQSLQHVSTAEDSTIRVMVYELRNRLGKKGRDLVGTIHGRGYKFTQDTKVFDRG